MKLHIYTTPTTPVINGTMLNVFNLKKVAHKTTVLSYHEIHVGQIHYTGVLHSPKFEYDLSPCPTRFRRLWTVLAHIIFFLTKFHLKCSDRSQSRKNMGTRYS